MNASQFRKIIFVFVFFKTGFIDDCVAQRRTDQSASLIDEKVTYEIPMAYELMHIAMALTDSTIVSNGYNVYHEVIDRNSTYYKEIIQHFTPFKNHVLVQALNQALRESASSYIYNVQLGSNLNFKNSHLQKVKVMPWMRRTNINLKSVDKNKLEAFARVSDFETFYLQHKAYYEAELNTVKENARVNEQQKWLEKEFSPKYDHYQVIISPVMGDTHFTQRFKFKGKRKCIMWVKNFDGVPQAANMIERTRYIGALMTEIDHNYVNLISDKYKKDLNTIMGESQRAKWASGGPSNSYKTGYKVFNEYMTHAVFLLFVNQSLTAAEQRVIEQSKIEVMIKVRKFIKFAEFYGYLKNLYQSKKTNETIEDLYPQVLEWCRSENLK